jgi:benzoyl-CoA reductase/2-hydroxyglutaryl-CoA dehydratase subunit BcrC/BadD/HgdB
LDFNLPGIKPLIDDEFVGEPAKRTLQYIQSKRAQGFPVVGVYCAYAPLEMIRAMKATVAVLCASSNKAIRSAEAVLPGNLCPLIKASYGFVVTDTCPFYGLSDVVVAETTCDGKKKMFELIRDMKPMHVMDLPHLPEEKEAEGNWNTMIRKLKRFLEEHLARQATDGDMEEAIRDTNRKSRKLNAIFEFAARRPPAINWKEICDLTSLAQPASAADMDELLDASLRVLEQRVERGIYYGTPDAPRVLVTGCPVAGDAATVFRVIEEAGGVIVAIDSCTGMKSFMDEIEENTGDPIGALTAATLR